MLSLSVVMKIMFVVCVRTRILPLTLAGLLCVIAAFRLLFANTVAMIRSVFFIEHKSGQHVTESEQVRVEDRRDEVLPLHGTDSTDVDYFSSLPEDVVVMCIWPKVVDGNINFRDTCRAMANATLVCREW
ncbi:hypothetical protein M758_6G019100, partial [Ceratodon purpureus]